MSSSLEKLVGRLVPVVMVVFHGEELLKIVMIEWFGEGIGLNVLIVRLPIISY